VNYRDPELITLLAGEYVLGTLPRAARARLEHVATSNSAVRAEIAFWQERLLPLALALAPIAPRADTYARIAARLGLARPKPRRSRARWLVPLAAAAVVLLAIGITWRLVTVEPAYVNNATVTQPDGRPLWQIGISERGDRLRIAATGAASPGTDKDFELWALSDTGGAPVSLGLVPVNGVERRSLDERQRAAVLAARQLAISIEPRGGSPTGAPTGPVVHVIDVRRGA
jgi:anti-sigma-K factor RskA